MKKKVQTMIIITLIALFIVPLHAFADDGVSTSSKSVVIVQYGPDGGATFTFTMTLESKLNWSRLSGQYTNFKRSEAILHTPSSSAHGIDGCNTVFSLRPSTNIGSTNVSLPYMGTYWNPANTYAFYVGRISTDTTFPWVTMATKYIPFSVTVDNNSTATPNPSKCFGGGSITDSFTVSH